MTPDPALERQRFVVLVAMRAGGVVVMLLGLWIWFGDLFPTGETLGPLVFVVGVVESLLIPAVLARKWRTPRRP